MDESLNILWYQHIFGITNFSSNESVGNFHRLSRGIHRNLPGRELHGNNQSLQSSAKRNSVHGTRLGPCRMADPIECHPTGTSFTSSWNPEPIKGSLSTGQGMKVSCFRIMLTLSHDTYRGIAESYSYRHRILSFWCLVFPWILWRHRGNFETDYSLVDRRLESVNRFCFITL